MPAYSNGLDVLTCMPSGHRSQALRDVQAIVSTATLNFLNRCMRIRSANVLTASLASRVLGVHGLVRWLLVLLLVFDQIGAPWHAHHHDSGIDGTLVAAAVPTDALESDAHVVASDDRPCWTHATTMLRVEAGPSLIAAGDNEVAPPPSWPAARSSRVIEGTTLLAIAERHEPPALAHRSLPPAPHAPPRRA